MQAMDHNLIRLFIIREDKVDVRCVPKIQCENTEQEDTSSYFKDSDLVTTLRLHGIFSYYPLSKTLNRFLNECDEVLLLIPDGPLNSYADAYSINKNIMFGYRGNMVKKKDWARTITSNAEDAIKMDALSLVSEDDKLLENKIFHKRYSECRSTRGDLRDLLRNYERVILFKMLMFTDNA